MHLGQTSTSRVEGNHHVIKSYVLTSRMDLFGVFGKIGLLLENQAVDIGNEINRQSIIVNNRHRLDVFQNLIYKVSQYALNMLYEQFLIIDLSMLPTVCTGKFRKTFGIPCTHQIRGRIECGTPLELADVHIQWHLQLILNEEAVENHNTIQKDTPRKRILAEMKEKLYRSDVYAGSMVARLKEILRTPYAQIEPPNAVTKKEEDRWEPKTRQA